jgi:tetratricopeptide (TPR) repeat protein
VKKYDAESHHFHKPGSEGASCAECHMPPKTYMVVDPRHDHSMRIPRPDLSVKLGTPNACNKCHADKDAKWAAGQVKTWYGHTPSGFQDYAEALQGARDEMPGAGTALAALIRNNEAPDIARATALDRIGPYLGPATIDVLESGLADDHPMVRVAAVTVLENAPLDIRLRLVWRMFSDPVHAVRMVAARVLAAVPAGDLATDQRALLDSGIEEYIASQQAMAERPEAQTNLGSLYASQGKVEQALSAFKTATALDPGYVPGYVNLADLYHTNGKETEAEKVLRRAAGLIPASADVHHALGLSLVRQKRTGEAVKELRLASTLNPDNARYVYIYAVALNSTGNPEQAIMVLQGAHNAHPHNVDILSALVAFHRDSGNHEAARTYAEKLEDISP